jgi:SRSO17 transposase
MASRSPRGGCGRHTGWADRTAPLAACRLLAEWPDGEDAPTKYILDSLLPTTSRRRLVRTAKGRWWVAQSYREMKDDLGLDHYEGRGWGRWPHHVVLVTLAYSFVVARRRQNGGDAISRG